MPLPGTTTLPDSAAQHVRRCLREEHGLEVDASTARYLSRRLEAGDEELLSFPATDRGGWAFRVLPATQLLK